MARIELTFEDDPTTVRLEIEHPLLEQAIALAQTLTPVLLRLQPDKEEHKQ